jgi:hypothetical protein
MIPEAVIHVWAVGTGGYQTLRVIKKNIHSVEEMLCCVSTLIT